MSDTPRICDYEGSTYRTDFWEGRGRDYEDLLERRALRRLLPTSGRRLLEIGAAYGRLSNEITGYDEVVLLDYSFSQLQQARQRYGDAGYRYVAADAYRLPFKPGVFDGATMIRVIHHFERPAQALKGIREVMAPAGVFLLEFASKRHLKARLRYWAGRQDWNPNDPAPHEFVELNFNFHPATMLGDLKAARFDVQRVVPVSFFRMEALKKRFSAQTLVRWDELLQRTGWRISPSLFTRNVVEGSTPDQTSLDGDAIFRCPQSGTRLWREGETLVSETGVRWAIRDGIVDFKQAL